MSSKSLGKCLYCNQDYCMECTNAEYWDDYCSKECENAGKKEKQKEIYGVKHAVLQSLQRKGKG